jgi:hypothetical protein
MKHTHFNIRRRRFLIAMFYVAAVIWGVHAAIGHPSILDVVLPVFTAFLATSACVADAELLGNPLALSIQGFMFFTWPIAVPIYLIWTRRFLGLAFVLAHAFCLVFSLLIAISAVTVSQYAVALMRGKR